MECTPEWNEAGQAISRMRNHLKPARDRWVMTLEPRKAEGMEALLRWLFAEGRQRRAETDLLAARASASGDIPGTTCDATLWQLWLRAECACDFVGQVFPEESRDGPVGNLPPGWDSARLMRWLLTESWHRRGDSWLKLVALEMVGPFPFYGLEAAERWETEEPPQ